MKNKSAKLFRVNFKDIVKGLITSILTAVVSGVYTTVNSGAIPTPTDLKVISFTGATAGIGYILKNVLTNSDDQFLKKENKK